MKENFMKAGFTKGEQRYKCKECGCQTVIRTPDSRGTKTTVLREGFIDVISVFFCSKYGKEITCFRNGKILDPELNFAINDIENGDIIVLVSEKQT
ncbi:MAG: hypothetical protein LBJ32_04200 [Oscillospiraceae bacterium]|jgi:hypothetical protein|nr:hypothetical protein [Oscillospiraceae bacterium]